MDIEGLPEDHDGRRVALIRIGIYGTVVAIVFLGALVSGLLPSPDRVRDWGEDLGPLAVIAYVPLFVLANFLIGWPILAGASGLLFGTAAGTALALAGVTAAAVTQMAISRGLAGAHAGRLLPRRTRGVEDFLERNGLVAVMESRILPLVPWGIVNYSAGLTRLRFADMALGTVVGATPKVFGYVALGGSLSNLDAPEAKIAIVLLVALALLGAVIVRRQVLAEGGAPST